MIGAGRGSFFIFKLTKVILYVTKRKYFKIGVERMLNFSWVIFGITELWKRILPPVCYARAGKLPIHTTQNVFIYLTFFIIMKFFELPGFTFLQLS